MSLSRYCRLLPLLLLPLLLSGCAMRMYSAASDNMVGFAKESNSTKVQQDRMLIWRGTLSLEVYNVSNATVRAVAAVNENQGYIESRSDSSDTRVHMRIRVPANAIKPTLGALEDLGTVTQRRLSSEDVTAKYIDTQARLKNRIALRDRLRELLNQAKDVKDILSIEKELHRVQADIDSMQGQLKVMKGQVDMATIDLTIRAKRILGPLGYVVRSAWWVVEKLFVIRE